MISRLFLLSLKITTLSIFAFSTMANDSCVTHAQCQNLTDESTACFVVDTGKNFSNKPTCEVKCYRVFVGSFCKFEKDKNHGKCEEENYKKPDFDPDKPDCSKAIPHEVLADIFQV